ncbi:MAG TPA: DUF302 domain-containing protein [Microlunatus sp.]|nr:DUF302 domain-containing protein [Microlunatus sp.]
MRHVNAQCRPPLAHGALQAEPSIGLLLRCSVLVRGVDDDHSRPGHERDSASRSTRPRRSLSPSAQRSLRRRNVQIFQECGRGHLAGVRGPVGSPAATYVTPGRRWSLV